MYSQVIVFIERRNLITVVQLGCRAAVPKLFQFAYPIRCAHDKERASERAFTLVLYLYLRH